MLIILLICDQSEVIDDDNLLLNELSKIFQIKKIALPEKLFVTI